MRGFILAAGVIVSTLAIPLHADQVWFKNGDQLTGKIMSMEGGKLIITSAVAGKVTVDLKDIKTFASDTPIKLRLNDGTIIEQRAMPGPDGQVAIGEGGVLKPQNVPLANIKAVNFNDAWTGSITAGGTLTRGNSNTEAFNLAINMVRRTEDDRFSVDAGYLYGREKIPGSNVKAETANDWFIAGKYDYFITPKFYAYGNARLERDLIAGISIRITPGVGAGYQWIDQDDFHLNTEGGISYLYRQYTHSNITNESVAARVAYHVDKKFNDKVSVFHNLEYLPGLDSIKNYFFDTDAGIRATLTDKMFTEFKVIEKYDSAPAPGKGHNDTQFVLGVGWTF